MSVLRTKSLKYNLYYYFYCSYYLQDVEVWEAVGVCERPAQDREIQSKRDQVRSRKYDWLELFFFQPKTNKINTECAD